MVILFFKIGLQGAGFAQFQYPHAVAVDAGQTIFVTDNLNNRVQIFDSKGRFVHAIGTSELLQGKFDRPLGIVVTSEGHVFVGDLSGRIQKFMVE